MSARINKRRLAAGVVIFSMLLFFTGIPGIFHGIANPASASECENLTAESPAVGDDCNEDPVVPEEFQDWEDVYRFGADGHNQWYFDCLQTRLGVSRDDVRRYKELEGQGHELRGIVISNTNVSDEAARDKLEADGVENVDRIQEIIRLQGFENTRGIDSDRCNPFGDSKPQVRLTLLIPKDMNDMSKGVHRDRGVLGMCGNPWKLPAQPVPLPPPPGTPPPENPPPTNPPPTNPPPTTPPSTTPPGCPPGTVPHDGRCVKPEGVHDTDGAGGDESQASQPVAENPPPPVVGAPEEEPPPAERPQDHPEGGSGDGGAPQGDGPVDDSDSNQETTSENDSDPCASGNPADCN